MKLGEKSGVLVPALASAYPVLALAAKNLQEDLGLQVLVFPLAVSIAVAALGWLLSGLLTREVPKRILVSLLWVVWFSTYGYVVRALPGFQPISFLIEHHLTLPLSLAVAGLAAFWIIRTQRPLADWSRFLSRATLVLLLFPLAAFVARATSAQHQDDSPASQEVLVSRASSYPDIYFIVLDSYTGSGSLRENYGFDNSEFIDFLQRRGFFVPASAKGNYATTFLALAAALNWRYLDDIPRQLGTESRDRTVPYRMIEDNRTVHFLRSRGYRFIFLPSVYGGTNRNEHADLVLSAPRPREAINNEFVATWFYVTPLLPITLWTCRLFSCGGSSFPVIPEPPEVVRWKFARLGALAGEPGPKFVFAHLLVPHDPFMFREDCTPSGFYWPTRVDAAEDQRMRKAYVDQVQCVNKLVTTMVNQLLDESPSPPVVILQSDHGYGGFVLGRPLPLEEVTPGQVAERMDIFGAYYLPGNGASMLYDSISPVNVLPAVLNTQLGTSIPLLQDRSYYSATVSPYLLTRVR